MSKETNQKRLQGLLQIMQIPIQRVADVVGMSRPYVSRIVNGDSSLGSPEFYQLVEENLPKIIQQRSRPFFDIEAVPQEQFDSGMAKLSGTAGTIDDLKKAS